MKKYISWIIAIFFVIGTLLYCYNKLNQNKQSSCPIFYEAKQAANANGQSFILINAPNWCKDCVVLQELYEATYQQSIDTAINSIGGFHIKLPSNNREDYSLETQELLTICEIKNVPSLIVFKDKTFTVKTDIPEIAATLFSATQQ